MLEGLDIRRLWSSRNALAVFQGFERICAAYLAAVSHDLDPAVVSCPGVAWLWLCGCARGGCDWVGGAGSFTKPCGGEVPRGVLLECWGNASALLQEQPGCTACAACTACTTGSGTVHPEAEVPQACTTGSGTVHHALRVHVLTAHAMSHWGVEDVRSLPTAHALCPLHTGWPRR